jgi:hypothetical protein
MTNPWTLTVVGDILLCHFPELPALDPGPKPSPALVVKVTVKDDGVVIAVVYGTTHRLHRLRSAEFATRKVQNPKLSTLHPSMMQAARAAYVAATDD